MFGLPLFMPLESATSNSSFESLSTDLEIIKLVEAIRKNHTLAVVLGEAHTTQAFGDAESLELAFRGELEKMDPALIQEQIATIRSQFSEVLDESEITDSDLEELLEKVWIYSRLTNPTIQLLEKVVSQMEHTEKTAVFASGMAAINATIYQFTHGSRGGDDEKYIDGDKIVVVGSIYGGTYAALMKTCEQTGRRFEHLPISTFEKDGLPDDTSMVLFESCNNPTLKVVNIPSIVQEAQRVGAKTICDNTFTPISICPAEMGINFTIHSMTKYIGGRSEDLGGSVSGTSELIDQFSDLHTGERMVGGGVMAPRTASRFLENLQDLPERLYLATQNAKEVKRVAMENGILTRFIEDSTTFAEMRDVRTPFPKDELLNGMVSLYFASQEDAHRFINTMIREGVGKGAVSLGATTTYYSIPAETTHSEMPEEERQKVGITSGLVRISCGTEENLSEKVEDVLKKILER